MLLARVVNIAAGFTLCASHAIAQTPREVAEKVMPSVVLLVMEDEHRQPLAMASGFVVRDGVIATNLHVIEGAASGYLRLVDEKAKQMAEDEDTPKWLAAAERIWSLNGVVASDPVHDLVLLSVEGLKAVPLIIGDSNQVAIGDQVYTVGNPQGLHGTFSSGIISGVRKVGEDSLLQITAPISPGSSGGPVVTKNGEVIGVAVATFKGGQNLNFAIPSEYLSGLLAQEGPPKPLSEAAKLASQVPSIMAGIGDRMAEGVTGADFIWDKTLAGFSAGSGAFSLTLRNNLRHDVRHVRYIVVFYNRSGEIIEAYKNEYHPLRLRIPIPAGLAARVEGNVHRSVQELTTPRVSKTPDAKVEIRILDFELAEPEAMRQRK